MLSEKSALQGFPLDICVTLPHAPLVPLTYSRGAWCQYALRSVQCGHSVELKLNFPFLFLGEIFWFRKPTLQFL